MNPWADSLGRTILGAALLAAAWFTWAVVW